MHSLRAVGLTTSEKKDREHSVQHKIQSLLTEGLFFYSAESAPQQKNAINV